MSATRPPGTLEALVGGTLVGRSLERRAPAARNPLSAGPEALRAGLEHFRENCLLCHGARACRPPGEAAKGLNPPPPDLARPDTQRTPDGELFEVIAHGVRISGMPGWLPTHSEREIGALVAFVRHLPAITAEERAALSGGEAEDHHAHAAPEQEGRPEEPRHHGR